MDKHLGRCEKRRDEKGAEVIEVVFGILVAVCLGAGFLSLSNGFNLMGGVALSGLEARYSRLAEVDPGSETGEPGGYQPADDGSAEESGGSDINEGDDTPVDGGDEADDGPLEDVDDDGTEDDGIVQDDEF